VLHDGGDVPLSRSFLRIRRAGESCACGPSTARQDVKRILGEDPIAVVKSARSSSSGKRRDWRSSVCETDLDEVAERISSKTGSPPPPARSKVRPRKECALHDIIYL
jgi:hypothetical protein